MADSSISGWLFKLGEKGLIKGWKKRFCVLESGRVYYYTSSSPEQRATTCKGFIELKTVTGLGKETSGKIKSPDMRHVFEIRTPDRIWYLAAESEAERTTWIESLESTVAVLCKDRTSTALLTGGTPDPLAINRSPDPAKKRGLLKSSSSRFKRFFKGKEQPEGGAGGAGGGNPTMSSSPPNDRFITTTKTRSGDSLSASPTTTQQHQPQQQQQSSQSPSTNQQASTASIAQPEPSKPSETNASQRSASEAPTQGNNAPERPASPFARMHRMVGESMSSTSNAHPEATSSASVESSGLSESADSASDLSESEDAVVIPSLNTRDDGAIVPLVPIFPESSSMMEDSYDGNSSDEESLTETSPPPPAVSERLSVYEMQNRISMNLKKMAIDPAFLLPLSEDESQPEQQVASSSASSSASSTPEPQRKATDANARDRLPSMATISSAPLPAPISATAPIPIQSTAASESSASAEIEPQSSFAPPSVVQQPPGVRSTAEPFGSSPATIAVSVAFGTSPASFGTTPVLPPRPNTPDPVSRRTKKAREIVQTELYYLDCLSTMLVHYMVPLRLAVQEKTLDFELTEDDVKKLFSTALTPIVDIHSALIQNLQGRFDTWSDTETKIADVILESSSKFSKSYIEYCANYDTAVATYDGLCARPSFTQLMLQFKLNSGKALGLSHLLIMPVQRIPRYKLLLDELLRDTPDTHPDYEDIKRAVATVESVAVTVNEGIRRRQSMRRMQLQYEELADAHRFLIWDGFVDTRHVTTGRQNTKFAIFNDLLLSISKQNAKNRQVIALPSSSRPLLLVWLKADMAGPMTWDIITPRKTYTVEQKLPEEIELIKNLTKALKNILGVSDVKQFSDRRRCRYVFSETVTYDGEWCVGQMEGFGRMYYAQIGVYEGQFAKDERHGQGKMTWTNGSVYDGQWVSGKRFGKGVMTFANGDRFEGNFYDGRRHGKGVMIYASGSKYDGEWEKDVPHGRGVFTSNLQGCYEGMWENGKFHGVGKYVDAGGATYQGEWFRGKRSGMGMYRNVASNGRVETYIGNYYEDQRHGDGKMTFFDGSFYEGRWENGERHGKGKYFFSSEDMLNRESYNGDWNRGRMSGEGELMFKNGDRWVGNFMDGVLHSEMAKVVSSKTTREIEGRAIQGHFDGAITLTYSVQGSGAPPRMIPMAISGTDMYQLAKKLTGPSFLNSLESNIVWPRLGAPVEPSPPIIELPKM